MPVIGQPAPDFELPNQDGNLIRLSSLRGSKVVIFTFPQAGSPGCTTQACRFRDDFPVFRAANATILGISGDKTSDLFNWKRLRNLPYDLLSDTSHTVLKEWGLWGMPLLGVASLPLAKRSYWVIDEQGIVLDGQVNVGAAESVFKALQALRKYSQQAS
jgi:peroxiredoxin Q/BCP